MKKAFLVDFENVKSAGLVGLEQLSAADEVVVLYSANSNTISFEMHQKILQSPACVDYYQIRRGGKNSPRPGPPPAPGNSEGRAPSCTARPSRVPPCAARAACVRRVGAGKRTKAGPLQRERSSQFFYGAYCSGTQAGQGHAPNQCMGTSTRGGKMANAKHSRVCTMK